MSFFVPWLTEVQPDGSEISRPILVVYFIRADGQLSRESLIVDSGADVSMAPRRLCEWLQLRWDAGNPIQLYGISPREDCAVQGRIHPVDIYISNVPCRLTIPLCFAEADAPFLLGRDGFFDAFRVQFDQPRLQTVFEPI